MKKFRKMTVFILSILLTAGSMMSSSTKAVCFDSLDSSTAVAGASAALSRFLDTEPDAAAVLASVLSPVIAVAEQQAEPVAGENQEVQEVSSDETLYDSIRTGLADVGSILNIRRAPSTLSDIVECAVRGAEILVLGEKQVNGNLWYKVKLGEVEGYVVSRYIAFDSLPEETGTALSEETGAETGTETVSSGNMDSITGAPALPADFYLAEDVSWLGAQIEGNMDGWAAEIRNCLSDYYPSMKQQENFDGMYSVLIYLVENCTNIMDVANEYGLTQIASQAEGFINIVEQNREALSAFTGKSEQQFCADISGTPILSEEEQQAAWLAASIAASSEAEAAWLLQQQAYVQASIEAEQAWLAQQQAWQQASAEQAALAAQQAAQQAAANPEETPAAAPQDTIPMGNPGQSPEEIQAAQLAWIASVQASQQAWQASVEESQRAILQSIADSQAAEATRVQAAAAEGVGTLGRNIADFAASWVGRINYMLGGDAFYEGGYVDCSHFTYHVLAQFGLASSYVYSGSQVNWGVPVDVSAIMPGDLVCYPGHVAIYYGNGVIVHAPAPGRMIEYGSLYGGLPVIAVRRLW